MNLDIEQFAKFDMTWNQTNFKELFLIPELRTYVKVDCLK